jgi:elongation factor Ts
MTISADMVKELRSKSGVGIMECKNALKEANGDLEKALEYLRKKGLSTAAKKQSRTASDGMVGSYIHARGKIGVLVEVNCETDFVAKTPEFQEFVKDIAMQIAATSPLCVRKEDVPEDVLAKEKEIYATQAKNSGKPDRVIDKIVEGRMEKFYSEACLLQQPFVKDTDKSINDLLIEKIQSLGENIVIKRFTRYQLGSDS